MIDGLLLVSLEDKRLIKRLGGRIHIGGETRRTLHHHLVEHYCANARDISIAWRAFPWYLFQLGKLLISHAFVLLQISYCIHQPDSTFK